MNLVHKIETWGDAHHPGFLDIVRIALGIFLLLKGVAFMENTTHLKSIIEDQDTIVFSQTILEALVYIVTFVHMVGGAMIALGVLTRFSCLIQLPIVLGAVFITDVFVENINAQSWLSIVALALLVLFLIIGSGPLSLDNYLAKMHED